MVERAVADGHNHLALTDANALYGVVQFAQACTGAGIVPILGMTVTVAADRAEDAPDEMVLLAQNRIGYRSLCRISTALQASPDREQLTRLGVDWDTIAANSPGLFCLLGGVRSRLVDLLRRGQTQAARRQAERVARAFATRCFLALELHREHDIENAAQIGDLADRLGLPTVVAQPIYCLEAADRTTLQLLAAIERNCRLEELPADLPSRDPNRDLHWLPLEVFSARYARFPSALANTAEIARSCEPALPDGRPIWPVLSLGADETPDEALARSAAAGLERLFADNEHVAQRLHRELATISGHGFAPLFLIVADIVHFSRRHSIPVSTRGSVANSLVAYCMGITTVDPIANDLLFERFLNPARSSLPDIDLDFCSRRRDEVLAYVRDTYGEDRVALVATISTLRPRSALRSAAKVHGLDEESVARLVQLLPDSWHPDPRRRVASNVDEVTRTLADPRERRAVHDAYTIVGQPDHLSVHPGGVVITPGPLTDYAPMQWSPKGFLITQFDHNDVEALGLPKIDLLGIHALTVLADAADLVRRHHVPSFDLSSISLIDQVTGDLLERGETVGVFQCESSGAQRTLRQLRARSVRDLAVANAFFKPGPATGGMAKNFIRRYRGEEDVEYLHPVLEPILRPTRGVLLFQEQILRVAREVAGLSWEEADALRRGMSKFEPATMDAIGMRFMHGCQRMAPSGPGLSSDQARMLWGQVKAFAGYGFNQGHATAYADVSYRSAYLKTHWPAAFLCARLANWGGYYHQAIYIAEARRLGIRVSPPNVNYADSQFTLTYRNVDQGQPVLWMGLRQVRDLRRSAVDAIIRERRYGHYVDLADLMRRVDLQSKEITHLVQCGGLDGLGESRSRAAGRTQAVAPHQRRSVLLQFYQ